MFGLYGLLDWLGQPTFYDKLLFVPVLNLAVRSLDRFADGTALERWTWASSGAAYHRGNSTSLT